jgi:hypothetical protein
VPWMALGLASVHGRGLAARVPNVSAW